MRAINQKFANLLLWPNFSRLSEAKNIPGIFFLNSSVISRIQNAEETFPLQSHFFSYFSQKRTMHLFPNNSRSSRVGKYWRSKAEDFSGLFANLLGRFKLWFEFFCGSSSSCYCCLLHKMTLAEGSSFLDSTKSLLLPPIPQGWQMPQHH